MARLIAGVVMGEELVGVHDNQQGPGHLDDLGAVRKHRKDRRTSKCGEWWLLVCRCGV